MEILRKQAEAQIRHDPSAVEVTLPSGEIVKGIFTYTQGYEDSIANTVDFVEQIAVTLFIDHAKDLIERGSILQIGLISYRVVRVLRQPDVSFATCELGTVR